MSVEELFKLRDNVSKALSQKSSDLHRQLAALGEDVGGLPRRGRPPGRGGSAMKGKKVAAKYRSPDGETWAGRGAMPRWMTAAIKEGKKRDDFLIDRSAAKATRGRRKKK